jgi:hypothetical protein
MSDEPTIDVDTTQTAARGETLINQTSEIPLMQQRSQEAYGSILSASLGSDIHPEMYDAVLTLTSCLSVEDTAAREAFQAMTAAYMEWDHAWSQTIHTTGLRSIPLLYGLPGDVEYLRWYDQRYGSQMTAEPRSACTRYAAAFQAWVEASS